MEIKDGLRVVILLLAAGLPAAVRAADAQPHYTTAAGLTALPPLSHTAARQPVQQYRITSLVPQAAVGRLYVGHTAITAPRLLSVAEASQLRFVPAAGLASPATFAFSYAADEGDGGGRAATYTILAQPASQLDFSTMTGAVTSAYEVDGVALTGSTPPANADSPAARLLAVGRSPYLPGVSLQWQQSFRDEDPAQHPNASTYTLTFSHPVAQLSLLLTDVDRHSTFTDVLTVTGYPSAGTGLPLAASQIQMATSASNCRRPGTSTVAGTSNSDAQRLGDAANDDGAVVVSFAQPVQQVQLTYENQAPYRPGGSRLQAIGLASLSWARAAVGVAALPAQAASLPVQVSSLPAPKAAVATIDLRQRPRGIYRAHLFRHNGKKQQTYYVEGGQVNELSLAAVAPGVYSLWLEGQPANRMIRLVRE